jgi:hypothetical protein
MELVYESKLILLGLFSDYLNFAVPDKSKTLPNFQFNNLFYDYDGDDLLIEEQKGAPAEEADLEQLLKLLQPLVVTETAATVSTTTTGTQPTTATTTTTATTAVNKLLKATSGRTGSLVKRRAESVSDKEVKPLDDSVASALLELVVCRILRGYDSGEEHPEHVLNILERYQDDEVDTSSQVPTSDKQEVDPYQYTSKNNIEVYKDSELRYLERKLRYKCQEILYKLSCTNFSVVYSKLEEAITISPPTTQQMMEQEIQSEQEQETEALNQAKQEAVQSGHDPENVHIEKRIPISKDDRVPYEEARDASSGWKVLQLMPYVNWTFMKLFDLLTLISSSSHSKQLIKYIQEYPDLCDSIKYGIWNWIYYNPSELKQLYQNNKSPPGALELFDALFAFQKGKKDRKAIVAPLMTTLMCICGDKMTNAVKSAKGSDNVSSFLHKSLLKTFKELKKKSKERAFTASVFRCFVEMFRVSSMCPEAAPLAQQAVQVEEGLKDIFITNTGSIGKYIGATNGYQDHAGIMTPEDEIVLTATFYLSLFTKDLNSSVTTVVPKILSQTLSATNTSDDAIYRRIAFNKTVLAVIAGAAPKQGSHRVPNSDSKLTALYNAISADLISTFEVVTTIYQQMYKNNQIIGHQQDFFCNLSQYDPSEIPAYYTSSTLKKKRVNPNSKGFYIMNRNGLVQTRTKYQSVMELSSALLHVFSADPQLFLQMQQHQQKNVEKNMNLLANTFVTIRHPEIQTQCIRFLYKFLLDQYVTKWLAVSSVMIEVPHILAFVSVTSSLLARLSRALFEEQNTVTIKKIISMIRLITYKCKVFYIRNREQLTSEIVNDNKRLQTLESLASNVLVSLCSPDKDIWKTTNKCLRDVCDQIELMHNEEIKNLNYSFYRQLSSVDLNADDTSHERRSQIQLFRRMEVQTSSNVLAFNEVFRLWRVMIKVPNANNDEWRDKFTNYTSLLCALGGVCIQQQDKNNKSSLDAFMSELMEHVTSSDTLVRQVVAYSIAIDLAPALYEKLFHYMFANMKKNHSDSTSYSKSFRVAEQYIYIVKTIVDSKDATFDLTLANDMDRLVLLLIQFAMLTQTKKTNASSGTQSTGTSTGATSGTQPTINTSSGSSAAKRALNTPSSPSIRDSVTPRGVGSVLDLSKLRSDSVRTSNASDTDASTPTTESSIVFPEIEESDRVQLKLKLSLLVETVMKKSEYISFDNEQSFRKQALNGLIKWTSYLKLLNAKLANTGTPILDASHADMDLNCMRAISALLSGYQIDNDSEQEFSEYFKFLIQYLESTPKSHHTFMIFIKKALNALLFSNVGFSLEYFMTMVYSKDEHVRSTFLSLLGLLMKRRRLDSNGDDEDDDEDDDDGKKSDDTATVDHTSTAENQYTRIVNDLFLAYNNRPVFILFDQVKSTEKDDACDAFVIAYQSIGYENLLKLLELSVQLEVNNTSMNQPGTLFRANSTASKLMKKYCSRVSLPYLQSVLGPLMTKVCNSPTNFEIDPSKMKSDEDINVNVANTKQLIQEFIDIILNNMDSIPYQFREYCRFLYKYVGQKFKMENIANEYDMDYSHIAVGGFLFLRLICPAITSPQQYGLTKDLPGNDARRLSIIITKVLQNIANGIYESKKEPFMATFEQFTIDNMIRFKKFFNELAAEPTSEQEVLERKQNAMPETVTDEELQDAHGTLHRYLADYSEATRPTLQVYYQTSDQTCDIDELKKNGTANSSSSPSAYDVLSSWLEKAGRPPEKKKQVPKMAANDQQYTSIIMDQFVAKMKNDEATAPVLSKLEQKHVFFTRGVTKKNEHVVYFLPSRMTSTEIAVHTDVLLYHVITTLAKVFQKQYSLVVDCTLWEPHIEIPFSVLVKLLKLLPKGAKKNLKQVTVINPNSTFKKLMKKFNPMLKKMNNIKLVNATAHEEDIKWEQVLNLDSDKSKQLISEQSSGQEHLNTEQEPDWINMLVPLPPHTLNIKSNALQVISGIQRVNAKLVRESLVTITKDTVFIVTLREKVAIGQKQVVYNRVDHFHVDGISDLATKKAFIGKSKDFQFKYNPNVNLSKNEATAASQTVTLRYNNNNDRDKLIQLLSELSAEKQRENAQRKLSATSEDNQEANNAQKKRLRPSDVPGQLLNICFLNMESSNAQTRYAAYNLLTSLIEQFQLPIHGIQESDIISVPRNTEDLVLEMSELVAKHKPDITLEFLNEALNAFTQIEPKSQVMCAKYMKPWIHNLSLFYSSSAAAAQDKKKEQVPQQQQQQQDSVLPSSKVEANSTTHQKLSDWFMLFTRVTCHSKQVFPAIAELWTLISQENQSMLYMGLEAAIQSGVEMGSVEADESLVNDLVITLSVHCPREENFALRIIQSIMDTLLPPVSVESTDSENLLNIFELVEKESQHIHNDKKWSKVIIYLRFLMNLSFQNRLNVVENAPQLLNLIIMLVGLGADLYIRSTLHALCCNLIHSLQLELPFLSSAELQKQQQRATTAAATEFIPTSEQVEQDKKVNEAKQHVVNNTKKLRDAKSIRGVFMGITNVEPAPFTKLDNKKKKFVFEMCNMYKIELLVKFLIDTMSNWTDHWNGIWKPQWEQLCLNMIYRRSSHQPCNDSYHIFYARSLVAYSILTCEENISDYDEDSHHHHHSINTSNSNSNSNNKKNPEDDNTVGGGPTTLDFRNTIIDLQTDSIHQEHLSKLAQNTITSVLKFLSVQNIQNLMPSTGIAAKDLSPGAKQKQQQDLLLSILLSLVKLSKKLNPRTDSQHLQLVEQLLFTGIVLLAITDVRIYNAVLRLLSNLFAMLYECGAFDHGYTSLSHYMNDRIRSNVLLSEQLNQFETIIGISFKEHFSFAFSTLLLKALVVESTRDQAVSLLKQLHMMQNKLQMHTRESLGYFCGLIPFDRQYSTASFLEAMFQHDVFYHEQGSIVFLYQKYLFTLVNEIKDSNQSNANEQAMLCIYRTLNSGFTDSKIRPLFSDVFKDHHSMSHVVRSYTSSENEKVIEACMTLFKSMSADIRGTALSMKEPFEQVGFAGFKKHRNFQVVNVTEVQKLVTPCQQLLAQILSNVADAIQSQTIPEQSPSASMVIEHHKSRTITDGNSATTATFTLPRSTRKKSIRNRFANNSMDQDNEQNEE